MILPILVWRFSDAPAHLRKLSEHGGDEDWLVELPPGYDNHGLPIWIEHMDACLTPQEHLHPSKFGWKVIIGAHA